MLSPSKASSGALYFSFAFSEASLARGTGRRLVLPLALPKASKRLRALRLDLQAETLHGQLQAGRLEAEDKIAWAQLNKWEKP